MTESARVSKLDRFDNEKEKVFSVKIEYRQEEEIKELYFNSLDMFEVKEMFGIFGFNYPIIKFEVKERL